jgi:hypothetical protein
MSMKVWRKRVYEEHRQDEKGEIGLRNMRSSQILEE